MVVVELECLLMMITTMHFYIADVYGSKTGQNK